MNFIKQSWIAFKSNYGFLEWESFLLIKIINPFFQMIFFVLLAQFSGSKNELAIIVIGNAMLMCVFTCIGELGVVYVRERLNGTLKTIIACGKNRLLLFFEKGAFHMVDAFLTAMFGLSIGYILFHIPIFNYPLLDILVVILISMFACIGLGFLLGSICLIVTDINLIYNILSMGMMFLCGANIPIEHLPVLLRFLSWCLPITRGIKAIEQLINGEKLIAISAFLIGEFLLGLLFFILSFIAFNILESLAKKKATIDLL